MSESPGGLLSRVGAMVAGGHLRKMTGLQAKVLLAFLTYADSKTCEGWPSVATISKDVGCGKSSRVTCAFKNLADSGIMGVIKRGGGHRQSAKRVLWGAPENSGQKREGTALENSGQIVPETRGNMSLNSGQNDPTNSPELTTNFVGGGDDADVSVASRRAAATDEESRLLMKVVRDGCRRLKVWSGKATDQVIQVVRDAPYEPSVKTFAFARLVRELLESEANVRNLGAVAAKRIPERFRDTCDEITRIGQESGWMSDDLSLSWDE